MAAGTIQPSTHIQLGKCLRTAIGATAYANTLLTGKQRVLPVYTTGLRHVGLQIPAGKVYLSPMIDCFDGLVISWAIGTRPDAVLVNTML